MHNSSHKGGGATVGGEDGGGGGGLCAGRCPSEQRTASGGSAWCARDTHRRRLRLPGKACVDTCMPWGCVLTGTARRAVCTRLARHHPRF